MLLAEIRAFLRIHSCFKEQFSFLNYAKLSEALALKAKWIFAAGIKKHWSLKGELM